MAEPLKYEEWVNRFVMNVATHFNLGGWHIDVKFEEENKESDSYAETIINNDYLTAQIIVYPSGREDFEAGKTKFLTKVLVHELVHLFLDPFHQFVHPHLSQVTSPYFMSTLEQQTQKLTMVILKTLPESLLPPR